MNTENEKEDNRLLKIVKIKDTAEGFADAFDISESRLKRIYKEIQAVMILNEDAVSSMIQMSKMYNDPHELAYALFMFGRLFERGDSKQVIMHNSSGSIEDLKDFLDKLTRRKEDE